MFRYDEFEASVAFTRETQNPQIDAYTIAGIDASPDIINQILEDIGTDEIDINRAMRCFREPDTD